MKNIENKCMLITYADSMGKNLKALAHILDKHFSGVFGGVHVLPFFPSSGDRGFAVINYDTVDPAFGSWEDIDHLAEKYYLMADFMLNHVSIRSQEFQDYQKKGDASPYRDMFIHWNEFWPGSEPTEKDLQALYMRKAQGPYKDFTLDNDQTVRLWNTFFEEQVDIDPYAKATQDYYNRNLTRLASHVPLVRFDALAYASKRPGTTCFFVEPDIWDVLDIAMEPLRKTGTEMLAEIHENYHIQQKMVDHGYWVYDFALPMLLLHGLMTGRTDRVIHWLNICPHHQFTTLDTHDGIGVVDVAGLLEEDEIELVCENVEKLTEEARSYIKLPSTIKTDGQKVRRYQLGCTYYSALDCDDDAYLLARAVQFFTPGIPQVYYVGLLAGENDMEALKNGGEGRSINRHNYTEEEIDQAVQKPMLQKLYRLMRFRNQHPAFDGNILVDQTSAGGRLHIQWKKNNAIAVLDADFGDRSFQITYTDVDSGSTKVLAL